MLLQLFKELEQIVKDENIYLKENIEIDSEFIDKLTMKKKVIQDKIEKFKGKLNSNEIEEDNLSEEEIDNEKKNKEDINNIIEKILKIEKENKELYLIKIEFVKKSLGSLYKEREVKTSYIKSGMKISSLDIKK